MEDSRLSLAHVTQDKLGGTQEGNQNETLTTSLHNFDNRFVTNRLFSNLTKITILTSEIEHMQQ